MDKKPKETIYVLTGEVKAGNKSAILSSSAIGSCIVIAAYDAKEKVGALAHILLPGRAPENKDLQKTKYAANAIEELIRRMNMLGTKNNTIAVCLVGGANVLERKDDATGLNNFTSVIDILKKERIKIKAKSVGGTERRSIALDVENGSIYYSVGNGIEKLLWQATVKLNNKGFINRGSAL